MTAPTPQRAASAEERERLDAPCYGIIDPDYARVFTMARCLAWQEGYALMMHGSFTRDLDLLAVPWAERVCEPEHLVRRVAEAADLRIITDEPGGKAHGRLAWTLRFDTFGDPRFVDLSVAPRVAPLLDRITAAEARAKEAEELIAAAIGEVDPPLNEHGVWSGSLVEAIAATTADRDRIATELAEARADAETVSSLAGKLEADRDRLADEVARLRSALKPFDALAGTWTVETAAMGDEILTLTNGKRMCGIKASAFIEARRALTVTGGTTDG